MSNNIQKVRIRLESFYPNRLDYSVREIIDAVKRTGAAVEGAIPLPNRTKKFTILTSPHVDKDARDQYQIVRHKRLLTVYINAAETMSAIKQMALPPEVHVTIKQLVDK